MATLIFLLFHYTDVDNTKYVSTDIRLTSMDSDVSFSCNWAPIYAIIYATEMNKYNHQIMLPKLTAVHEVISHSMVMYDDHHMREIKARLWLHIQIPPTGYVGLLFRSSAVATASWSTFEGYCEGTLIMLLWQKLQSTLIVPSTVLRLAVATSLLPYMRPT